MRSVFYFLSIGNEKVSQFIGDSVSLPLFVRKRQPWKHRRMCRRDYNIEVAGGSDPATFIPVIEIRGSNQVLHFIATGVHGYEFAPILAAEKLAEAIDPKQLSGIVLVTRPSHVSAFEARSPYVNPDDRMNLNRSFPGDPSGTQTERIAHIIFTQLIARSDFVVDVHSGDGAEWLHPFIEYMEAP